MRWSGLLPAAALIALAAPAPAGLPVTRRLRAVNEWNAVYLEIQALAEANPARAGKLERPAALSLVANPLVDGDLQDLVTINGLVGKAVNAPTQPQSVRDAFSALALALGGITSGVLDDFEEEIDTFASVNPDRNVTKQRKALEKARGIVAKALERPATQYAQQAIQFGKALAAVRSAKLFPYVAKARKGDCVGGSRIPLDKGEFAYGPWAIFDFDSQSVEGTWFEANWGNATVRTNDQGVPTLLSLNFGYCDGRNTSISNLQVNLQNPGVGTFGLGSNVGAFQRGPGFASPLTSNSSLTITALNLEDGFVAGRFSFQSNNGAGQGSGDFVIRIDE